MNKEKNTALEFKADNKTEQLKLILEQMTSLTDNEVNIIRALTDLSRELKIEE